MMKHMPFLYVQVGNRSAHEAHGSLRMVAKQFSVNVKDLCDMSFVSTFDRPNKTDVMIITQAKSDTRTI